MMDPDKTTGALMRFGYNAALHIASPGLAACYLAACLKDRKAGVLWRRLGFFASPEDPENRESIWVHGVSVGEVQMASALLPALEKELPVYQWLVSSSTAAGFDLAQRKMGEHRSLLFPIDLPFSISRSLRYNLPRAAILLETELWPNFIRMASSREVKLLLVNGRLSDRHFPTYRRFAPLFRDLLARFDGIAARSDEDAERFLSLGASPERMTVTGNLKFAQTLAQSVEPFDEALWPEGVILWIAGSTHPSDEEVVLAAYRKAAEQVPQLKLVLVPRHPTRFREAERDVVRAGFTCRRRSTLSGGERLEEQVLLVDSIGELTRFYARGDITFVGGTFSPKVGGHNLLEPAASGKPVLFGPHVEKTRDEAALLRKIGGGFSVSGVTEMADIVTRLSQDKGERDDSGRKSQGVVESGRAILDRTIEFIVGRMKTGQDR